MADKSKPSRLDLAGLSLDAIVAQVNNKYGVNTLVRADKAISLKQKWISTGVHALDFATGGGIPQNRITEFRGPESSLKSTITHFTEANFLRDHPADGLVIHADVEKSYDQAYAFRIIGANTSRIAVMNPDSGEQCVDVIAELLSLDRPTLFAVDSIAAITPSAELEASMDQQTMALQARLINRMMRVVVARMKRYMYDLSAPTTTILCINQLREKVGVVYGNPETTPGGKGKDFAYSLKVRISSTPSQKILEDVTQHGVKRKIGFGQEVNFSVSKNKCFGGQHEEGSFEFYKRPYKGYPALSFNNAEALFKFGTFLGVISSSGGAFRYGRLNFKSGAHFIRQLVDDSDLSSALYVEVMAAVREDDSGAANTPGKSITLKVRKTP